MRFLVIRAIEAIVVVWAVGTIAFVALRLGRVDPIAGLLAQGLATPDQAAAVRVSLGLDRPLGSQYLDFIGGALHGDLGRSIFSDRPVGAIVSEALGYTVPLAALAWSAAVLFGLAAGVLAAGRGEKSVRGITGAILFPLLSLGAATPVAWSGLVFLWGSALAMPAASPGWLREGLRLLLPSFALALPVGAAIGRAAEAGIRNIRPEPFVLAMRARGVPEGWRMDRRLLRAALAPVLALAGLEAAFLLGGTMITEVVFARPGVGRLLVDSILGGDYPVVQVLLPLAALGYLVFGSIADWGASRADPRMRDVP